MATSLFLVIEFITRRQNIKDFKHDDDQKTKKYNNHSKHNYAQHSDRDNIKKGDDKYNDDKGNNWYSNNDNTTVVNRNVRIIML